MKNLEETDSPSFPSDIFGYTDLVTLRILKSVTENFNISGS